MRAPILAALAVAMLAGCAGPIPESQAVLEEVSGLVVEAPGGRVALSAGGGEYRLDREGELLLAPHYGYDVAVLGEAAQARCPGGGRALSSVELLSSTRPGWAR